MKPEFGVMMAVVSSCIERVFTEDNEGNEGKPEVRDQMSEVRKRFRFEIRKLKFETNSDDQKIQRQKQTSK